MINLDAYINHSIEVILDGKQYHVNEPGLNLYFQIDKIEADLKSENLHQKRLETALLLMNNNAEGHRFTKEDLIKIPFEGINELVGEISRLRLKTENDPNSESPSRPGK